MFLWKTELKWKDNTIYLHYNSTSLASKLGFINPCTPIVFLEGHPAQLLNQSVLKDFTKYYTAYLAT